MSGSENPTPPSVVVVMGTFQGERFLRRQLDSLASQSHVNWRLFASDDGSTDATVEILKSFELRSGKPVILHGPRKGFAANFIAAICEAPDSDYFAFSDQDDVWEIDKLERALGILATFPSSSASLYCGRTRLIDENENILGQSPAFRRPPSFENALVQCIAGGNTMVMNRAARDLIRRTSCNLEVVSHDWWAYLLVSGSGGLVYYDIEPKVLYRQHSANVVGKNNTWRDRVARARQLLNGRFRSWTDCHIAALTKVQGALTVENQAKFHNFKGVRSSNPLIRLKALKRSGVYRQTRFGQFGLFVAVVLKKL